MINLLVNFTKLHSCPQEISKELFITRVWQIPKAKQNDRFNIRFCVVHTSRGEIHTSVLITMYIPRNPQKWSAIQMLNSSSMVNFHSHVYLPSVSVKSMLLQISLKFLGRNRIIEQAYWLRITFHTVSMTSFDILSLVFGTHYI
jgi:hypothetical protein